MAASATSESRLESFAGSAPGCIVPDLSFELAHALGMGIPSARLPLPCYRPRACTYIDRAERESSLASLRRPGVGATRVPRIARVSQTASSYSGRGASRGKHLPLKPKAVAGRHRAAGRCYHSLLVRNQTRPSRTRGDGVGAREPNEARRRAGSGGPPSQKGQAPGLYPAFPARCLTSLPAQGGA